MGTIECVIPETITNHPPRTARLPSQCSYAGSESPPGKSWRKRQQPGIRSIPKYSGEVPKVPQCLSPLRMRQFSDEESIKGSQEVSENVWEESVDPELAELEDPAPAALLSSPKVRNSQEHGGYELDELLCNNCLVVVK